MERNRAKLQPSKSCRCYRSRMDSNLLSNLDLGITFSQEQQGFSAFTGSPVLAPIDYILKKIPIFIRERK